MIRVVYKVTGLSSLLMNNPECMGVADSKKSPQEQAKNRAYMLKSGQLYMPAPAFRKSLITGCTGRKIGKSAAGTIVGAAVFIPDSEMKLPLMHPKTGKPIKTYQIHSIRAVVNKSGIKRHRPEVAEWACRLHLDLDEELLPLGMLTELLGISGKMKGAGDFRIEKGGQHGRYMVELESDGAQKGKRKKK